MESRYDVIISGAGPSGSLLGFLLSQNNINTLIIDKMNFPRHKICAGGLQDRALELIPFDIKSTIHKSFKSILFSLRGRESFTRKYSSPIIHTVDRKEFDNFLAARAASNGCTIRFGEEVIDFEHNNRGIMVKTGNGRYTSKILIGADGIRGLVHRRIIGKAEIIKILGYELEKKTGPDEDKETKEHIGLDFGGTGRGYMWVFPKRDAISYGIGGPVGKAVLMRKYIEEYFGKDVSGNNGNGPKIMAQCIPVRKEDTPLCRERVLLIGDAACLGDAFTGEGIYNALRSSHLALESIMSALKRSEFSFKDYLGSINGSIYRDIKISLIFSRIFFTYPLFFYKLLKTNDKYFKLCCEVLKGSKKYTDISGRLNVFSR
ncbi:MAG: NAD(P)/FAD-dependent oxidoreductase [Actinobacteria bacterium]|nr:NAD(P)/FAD-dependent oxidoreductase [Actinomycetota bacterium]